MGPLRILIVDDHQAVRRGVRSLLSMHDQWSVCGEAGDGYEAIERAKELKPDLILMDLSMPRMGGVEATRNILRENPESKVIIVSQNDPAVVRQQAREIGARAYVPKADLARDLLPTIENVVGPTNGRAPRGEKLQGRQSDAESESQIHAQKLVALLDTSALGLAVLDLDGGVIGANAAFCAITGLSPSELNIQDGAQVIHAQDRDRMQAQLQRLIAGEIPSFVLDHRFSNRKHEHVWVQSSISLTRKETGAPLNIVMLCQEFTEHRRLISQFREGEQRFREMIDTLPVAIYTTDGEGRVTHFNPAAVKFSGRVPELGSTKWCVSWKLYYPNGRPMPHEECPMGIALREGRIIEGAEALAERPDGGRVWFSPYPQVFRDAEGKIVGGINMLLDITERKLAERTTNLLAAIVDSSDDAIVSKRLDGIITSWNQGAERLFGYTAKEAIGRHIGLIIPRDRLEEETDIISRLKRGERVDHFETVRIRKDGAPRDISVTISPVRDASGEVVGASKVARDITDRKRTEKSLADRAREHKALYHLADEMHRARSLEDVYEAGLNAISAAAQCDRASILLYDDAGVMRFVKWRGLSESYRKATEGHSPWRHDEENPLPICMNRIDDSNLGEAIKAVVKNEGIEALTFIPLVASGKLIGKFMMYFDSPHEFDQGETDLSLTIARQIAFGIDRKRSEEELRASEERFRKLSASLDAEVRARTEELEQRNQELMCRSEQLRELSRRMLQAQDAERRHIARELHDSAGQTLTVLNLNLSSLAKNVVPGREKEAEEALHLVQQLSREIRTSSYLLHPPLLDENGLVDALNWYVEGLIQRSDLEIGVLISEEFGRLPSDLELVIFRLVQESLNNIHRHSGSKSATIRIARRPISVYLEVEDYGRGIPPEKLAQIHAQGSGVGIRGMGERVRQFGGEMNIESNGSGTKIFVTLPIPSSHPRANGSRDDNLEAAAD
jgi:PAS domain S-box-containing protein